MGLPHLNLRANCSGNGINRDGVQYYTTDSKVSVDGMERKEAVKGCCVDYDSVWTCCSLSRESQTPFLIVVHLVFVLQDCIQQGIPDGSASRCQAV